MTTTYRKGRIHHAQGERWRGYRLGERPIVFCRQTKLMLSYCWDRVPPEVVPERIRARIERELA